jgi:RHS repeat-associated protein
MRELSGYSTTGLTDYTYTGQRDLEMGLMDYKARFYSPYLNRFTQPDTLIPDPGNPQAWNRFSYVANRPLTFNDPTGHAMDDDMQGGGGSCDSECWQDKLKKEKKGNADTNDGGLTLFLPPGVAEWFTYVASHYYYQVWYWDAWLYQYVPSAFGFVTPGVNISGGVLTVEGTVTTLFNYRAMELNTYTTAGGGGVLSFPPGGASANFGLLFVYGASSNRSWEGEYVEFAGSLYNGFGGSFSDSYSVQSRQEGFPATIDPVSRQHINTKTVSIGVGTPGVALSATYGDTPTNKEWMNLDWPFSMPLVLPNNPFANYPVSIFP